MGILCGGDTETYEPRFTYHGFRYVEVTGYPGKPTLDAIEGRFVHNESDGRAKERFVAGALGEIPRRQKIWRTGQGADGAEIALQALKTFAVP